MHRWSTRMRQQNPDKDKRWLRGLYSITASGSPVRLRKSLLCGRLRTDSETIAAETMSQPRASLWVTEEIDEDLQVDVNLALGNYGQNGLYDDGAYIRSIFCLSLLPPFALQPNQKSMKPPSSPCSIRWRNKQRLRRFLMLSSECVSPW